MRKTPRKRAPRKGEGRQPKVFQPSDSNLVRALAIIGVTQDNIARILSCDSDTLRKHFRQELDEGSDRANAAVVGALYHQAVVEGNVSAQIFWCKTRLGWREKDAEPQPQTVTLTFQRGPRPERLTDEQRVKAAA